MWSVLKSRLSPFRHRDFRNFFFAQNFSLIGTWSSELARSWLVLTISGSATALGTVLLATSLPGLFLSLHGGVIADQVDVKKFLRMTKGILAAVALLLFIITHYYTMTIPLIILFGFIEGIVNSYDGPCFTAMFARLVPRDDFQQALAIQSSNFHLSRMLGPLVAGGLMAWKGPAYVFLFDALSYLWVIWVIGKIQLRPIQTLPIDPTDLPVNKTIETTHRKILKLFDGLRHFYSRRTLRYMLFHFFLGLAIVMPVATVIFRTFLKQKFHLDASEFGILFAFPAVGSMTGTFYFILAKREKPIQNLRWAVPLLVISLLAITYSPTPEIAAVLLAIVGFFSYVNIASVTQSMHLEIPDSYRGRLGAVIGLGFMTISPLMSFPVGIYTDYFGYDAGIIHFTLLFALGAAALAFWNRKA